MGCAVDGVDARAAKTVRNALLVLVWDGKVTGTTDGKDGGKARRNTSNEAVGCIAAGRLNQRRRVSRSWKSVYCAKQASSSHDRQHDVPEKRDNASISSARVVDDEMSFFMAYIIKHKTLSDAVVSWSGVGHVQDIVDVGFEVGGDICWRIKSMAEEHAASKTCRVAPVGAGFPRITATARSCRGEHSERRVGVSFE